MEQKLAGMLIAQCSPYHLTKWLGEGRGRSCGVQRDDGHDIDLQ